MKRSQRKKLEGECLESERRFSVTLDPNLVDWVEEEARRRGATPEGVLEGIITRTVTKESEPLGVQFRRVNRMIRDLVALAKNTLAQEVREAGQIWVAAKLPPAYDERKKRRDHLLELGMQAYEELRQISSSEQAAKEAGYRMQAYQVMARVGAFNEAVIRDQEAEDVAQMILELEEGNERLEESMEEIEKELGLRGKKREKEEGEV